MVLMQNRTKNLKIEIADGLLPSLIDIQNSFLDVSQKGNFLEQFFEYLGTAIRTVDFAVMGLSNSLGALKDVAVDSLSIIKDMWNGMSYDDARKKEVDQLKTDLLNRLDNVGKENTDLWKHDKFFGDPTAPYEKPRQLDSKANQRAIDALQDAANKPKRDSELNQFNSKMNKLGAEDTDTLKALQDELSAVTKTAAQLANLNDERATEKKIKEETLGMTKEHIKAYTDEANADLKLRESLRLTNEEQKRTFEYGVAEWSQKYQQDVSNTAAMTSSIMQKSFDGMTDSLTKFVEGGKLQFGTLVQSIIADLIKMEIQSQIMGPLAGALFGKSGTSGASTASSTGGLFGSMMSYFGFADGGIMTSVGPMQLKKYASGGIANTPQLAMYGEGNGAEAYVPLPDGRSIPVSMAGGAGGDTHVGITLNMGDGGVSSGAKGPNASQASNLGVMLANTVKAVLVNEKRQGGLLSASPTGN